MKCLSNFIKFYSPFITKLSWARIERQRRHQSTLQFTKSLPKNLSYYSVKETVKLEFRMSVKFEKIYDNLVKVEWATAIEDGQGGVEENFQLNCLQPCIPHFDVSYTYSFISGKQKFSPDKTVGYLSYNIELCLKQLKHPAQQSLVKSSGEREGNNVNTEVCHRPTAIWASFNGGEKLLLKKSSGLNEWKSQKFPVDVKITREGWLVSKSFKMVVQLWIKFKSMSCGEIQTLNHVSNLFAQ